MLLTSHESRMSCFARSKPAEVPLYFWLGQPLRTKTATILLLMEEIWLINQLVDSLSSHYFGVLYIPSSINGRIQRYQT